MTDVDRHCKHTDVRPGGYHGPRLPLRYGSAEINICADCGMWHDVRDTDSGRRAFPLRPQSSPIWRPAAELLIAIARRNEE
jgi:hypothetical protein